MGNEVWVGFVTSAQGNRFTKVELTVARRVEEGTDQDGEGASGIGPFALGPAESPGLAMIRSDYGKILRSL